MRDFAVFTELQLMPPVVIRRVVMTLLFRCEPYNTCPLQNCATKSAISGEAPVGTTGISLVADRA